MVSFKDNQLGPLGQFGLYQGQNGQFGQPQEQYRQPQARFFQQPLIEKMQAEPFAAKRIELYCTVKHYRCRR
jgi:hypothetical protein